MSEFLTTKRLSDAVNSVLVPFPDGRRRILIARLTGTFVGTLKLQTSDDGKTFTDGSVFKVDTGAAGNPTAQGVYAALLGATAKWGRILFSAYTSGEVFVEATTIPQAP